MIKKGKLSGDYKTVIVGSTYEDGSPVEIKDGAIVVGLDGLPARVELSDDYVAIALKSRATGPKH